MKTRTPYYNYYKHLNLINNNKENNDIYNSIRNNINYELIKPLMKCWLDDFEAEGIENYGIGPQFTNFISKNVLNNFNEVVTQDGLIKDWICESVYRDYIFCLLFNITNIHKDCDCEIYKCPILSLEVYSLLHYYEKN